MTVKPFEVDILGKKFKTINYLQTRLNGRFPGKPISMKTLRKYIVRGMPHFVWGSKTLFSEEDLKAIPDWICENCRPCGRRSGVR